MSNLTVINQSLSSSFDTLGAGGLLQGNNNLIINGDFEIAQRGTSFPNISGNTSNFILDRYNVFPSSDGICTVSQDTDVPTYNESGHKSQHSIKFQITTADTSIGSSQYLAFYQAIEGYLLYPAINKNITISFWVKSKLPGIYCLGFRNSGVDRSYIKEFTINVADTWEKKILSIPMNYSGGTWNYTTGAGIFFHIALACGSTYHANANSWQSSNSLSTSNQVNFMNSTNNYINFAQIKLEIGNTATPFQPRNYIDELRLCQRYYEIVNGGIQVASASTTIRGEIFFKATKRTNTYTATRTGDWITGAESGTTVFQKALDGFTYSNGTTASAAGGTFTILDEL